jgi:hypothetical protein
MLKYDYITGFDSMPNENLFEIYLIPRIQQKHTVSLPYSALVHRLILRNWQIHSAHLVKAPNHPVTFSFNRLLWPLTGYCF